MSSKDSKFASCPEKFLRVGQRVKALIKVWDGGPDSGDFLHAEAGELGTVVHVEPGFWPTVRFDRSGTSTCVSDFEVEPVLICDLCNESKEELMQRVGFISIYAEDGSSREPMICDECLPFDEPTEWEKNDSCS